MRWDARRISMPLASGRFAIAGDTMEAAEALLVSLADGRRVGFGEAVASTRVLGVGIDRLHQDFGSVVAGLPVEWLGDTPPVVPGTCHGALACAVDGALLDLAGQRTQRAVYDLLELPAGTKPTSATVSIDTPERMAEEAQHITRAGFQDLKLKLGGPPDMDIQRLHAVVNACPKARLRVDGNEGWSLDDAVSMVPALADAGVTILEQPMKRQTDMVTLVKLHSVCSDFDVRHYLDEPIRSARDVRRYADGEGVDGVNIKLQKTGGLRRAIDAVAAARANGLEVMLGCFVESWAGIALAAQLVGSVDHVDLDGAWLLASPLLVANPPILAAGMIGPSEAPGLGLVPRRTTTFAGSSSS